MQESGTSASPCLSRCSANPSRGPARRVEIRLPATSRTQLVCRPREDPMELRGVGTRQCHLNCCLVSHFPVPGPGRRGLPDQARVVRPALGSITGRHTAWDAREHGRALPPMETQSPLLMNNGSKWPRWPRPCHEAKRGERRGPTGYTARHQPQLQSEQLGRTLIYETARLLAKPVASLIQA